MRNGEILDYPRRKLGYVKICKGTSIEYHDLYENDVIKTKGFDCDDYIEFYPNDSWDNGKPMVFKHARYVPFGERCIEWDNYKEWLKEQEAKWIKEQEAELCYNE